MIAIIGAMDEEVSQLIKKLSEKKEYNYASMVFYSGKINNKDFIIVKSGIGKVNAAACTQIIADKFNPDVIINTGIAGAIDNKVDFADIVIATDAVEYDMDVTNAGYKLGQIPRMDVYGFTTKNSYSSKIYNICKSLNYNVHEGRIVTGDKFVNDLEMKKFLQKEFNAYCTEMEGAAIAHVAYLNNIDCVIIRAISDKADNNANIDYDQFEKQAIDKFVNIIIEYSNN